MAIGGLRVYLEDTPGKSLKPPTPTPPKDYDKALTAVRASTEGIKQDFLKRLKSCPVMDKDHAQNKPAKPQPKTKEPTNAVNAVFSDQGGSGPLSREKALSQVSKPTKSLLDFMQSTLD
jgi:hypothetical protein